MSVIQLLARWTVLVAVGKGAVVRTGLWQQVPAAAELRAVYVRPSWRGQGIGRQLAALCVQAAHWHGYRRIELSALGPDERFYASCGFLLAATIHVAGAKGRRMYRDLAGPGGS